MSKSKKTKEEMQNIVAMPVIHPNAAGIDVSATAHMVAVPLGRDEKCVREFGAFTCDLKAISKWLKECGVETVAMESTGVYWKQLFAVLIEEGFEVYLVNARHVRNVTGRKTDEDDAQWIQKLHSCGLLKTSFLPDDPTETLRTLVRFRRNLTRDSTRFILRMQKSLELMNIKVHTVISDIVGKTGTAIIEAIINGERKPENFIQHIDGRIKASQATILKSLEGNWRREQLITLKQSYEIYKFLQRQILDCEKEIKAVLLEFIAAKNEGVIEPVEPAVQPAQPKKKNKNNPFFDVRTYLEKIHGVDVISIYGLSETSGLEILAETGTDLSRWESEDKFVSWLNLCPNNKISGGKLISSNILKKNPNLTSQAFRAAANSLFRSDHWLGDYFRRMRAKGGQKYAIVATARKLAIIYYKMVRYKTSFTPVDIAEYKEKYRTAKIAYLERKLLKLKAAA